MESKTTPHTLNFTIVEKPNDEEPELPKYSDKGRILVRVGPTDSTVYKNDYEVLDYDQDSSVFWINEGVGFDYWLDRYFLDFPTHGVYMIENITGSVTRDYWGEYDEDWDSNDPRPATKEEIAKGHLT